MTLERPLRVLSRVGDSTLFTYLDNRWEFGAGPTPASTWLSFHVEFAFKSPLYGQVATVFFEEVSEEGPPLGQRRRPPAPLPVPPLSLSPSVSLPVPPLSPSLGCMETAAGGRPALGKLTDRCRLPSGPPTPRRWCSG